MYKLKKKVRVPNKITSLVLIITMIFSLITPFNTYASTKSFVLDQSAPAYAKKFIEECEGQTWFIDEVEKMLNAEGKTINYAVDSSYFENIYSLNFTGKKQARLIPKSIKELKSLKYIFLADNLITSIPEEIYTLTNLEILDLSYNNISSRLSGDLAKLTKLKNILLQNNRMYGNIPASIFNLRDLTTLDVSGNELTGEIPPNIGSAQNLVLFAAANNKIEGKIPGGILNIKSLKVINLWDNKFTGNMFVSFENLDNLELLDLSQNSLTGELPILPDSIIDFAVRSNMLTGVLPDSYGNLSNIEILDVSLNQITGEIPLVYKNLQKLEKLDLSDNKLNGLVPDIFVNMKKMKELDFSNNYLVGHIPKSLSEIALSGGNVDMSKNYLTGTNLRDVTDNSDNFLDIYRNYQNRMYLPEYSKVLAGETFDVYQKMLVKDSNLKTTNINKEKLEPLSYILTFTENNNVENLLTKYEVESLDEIFLITHDQNGIKIEVLKDIEEEDALEFNLMIKYNHDSQFSQTVFKLASKIPKTPSKPDIPGGGGSGGGGSAGGGGTGGGTKTPTNVDGTVNTNNTNNGNTINGNNSTGGEHIHSAYISGYNDKTIRSESYITREEAAQIIYNIHTDLNKDSFEIEDEFFKDVKGDMWAKKAIYYLESQGILSGYEDGSFRPKESMTREELASIIYNYRKFEGSGTKAFEDVKGRWSESYVTKLADENIISGYEDGKFRPGINIKRIEVIAMVNKMLGRNLSVESANKMINPFKDLDKNYWGYAHVLEATINHKTTLDKNGYEVWN